MAIGRHLRPAAGTRLDAEVKRSEVEIGASQRLGTRQEPMRLVPLDFPI